MLPDADKNTEPKEQIGLAERLGNYAHANRDYFTSQKGELFFRNILRTLVGVVPTVVAFVLTRMSFEKYEKFAVTHKDALLTKVAKPFMSEKSPVGRSYTYILGGYIVFRSFCKLWQRAYDRLFSAEDAAHATDAIRNMPANAWKDFKENIPGEIAGVAIAAFPLAAVKAGFANPATLPVNKGQFAMAKKGFVNDWLASTAAYLPFFETADRIYGSVTDNKDSPEYYRKLKGLPEAPSITREDKKFGFFSNDGIGRLVFRRGVSLLLGLSTHMGGQRLAKAAVGVPNMAATGSGAFVSNVAKEYAGFAPFATYTAISETYNAAYDKLFDRLEQKFGGKSNRCSCVKKSEGYMDMLDKGRTSTQQQSAQVQ